jgi:hypothetical protein
MSDLTLASAAPERLAAGLLPGEVGEISSISFVKYLRHAGGLWMLSGPEP